MSQEVVICAGVKLDNNYACKLILQEVETWWKVIVFYLYQLAIAERHPQPSCTQTFEPTNKMTVSKV